MIEVPASIQGLNLPIERETLFKLAQKAKTIVEVGAFKGKMTYVLSKASEPFGGTVYPIDPFAGPIKRGAIQTHEDWFSEFMANMSTCPNVMPIRANSEDAVKTWNKPIDLLFIDGWHEYESVKKDVEMWLPFLVEGGVIALHDVGFDITSAFSDPQFFGLDGPRRVAKEMLKGNYINAHMRGTLFIATRVRKNRRSLNIPCRIHFMWNYLQHLTVRVLFKVWKLLPISK